MDRSTWDYLRRPKWAGARVAGQWDVIHRRREVPMVCRKSIDLAHVLIYWPIITPHKDAAPA